MLIVRVVGQLDSGMLALLGVIYLQEHVEQREVVALGHEELLAGGVGLFLAVLLNISTYNTYVIYVRDTERGE